MDEAKNFKDLRARLRAVKVGLAGDTRLAATALVFIAERLVAIEARLAAPARKRRAPSAWQRFFAAGMKAGKTPTQIGAEWKARKA